MKKSNLLVLSMVTVSLLSCNVGLNLSSSEISNSSFNSLISSTISSSSSLPIISIDKGPSITVEEAGLIIDDLIMKNDEYAEADVEDAYSFTIEVDYNEIYEDKTMETEYVCKFDSENQVIYYLKNDTSLGQTGKKEFYCGLKDGRLYYFNVVEKEYSVTDEYIAEYAWKGMTNYLKFPLTISNNVLLQLKAAVEIGDETYKYYSSGEGNLVTEFTQQSQENYKTKYIYAFDDYKITKEIIRRIAPNASLDSISIVKYSASVVLPSINDYTKV